MENFRRCRICISESAVMMSIFGEDALWRKIKEFADVQIEEDDSLPQQICVMCARDAIKAFSFKQKCEKADRFFRKQLRDDEVMSVSSRDGIDNEKEDKKFPFNFWNFGYGNNPLNPIVVDDSSQHPSENNDQHWNQIGDEDHDNNENHPLIPVIELITPNDDNKPGHGYQCSICYEFFAMKSIIKHHIKTKHPEANPTYECFECKKKYLCKRFLDKHMRRGRCVKKRKNHSRAMKCADCHEVFPSGHHLGWHKRAGNCPSKMINSVAAPVGPEDSDSEEEKLNERSTTEKEKFPKAKTNNRRKWGKRKHKGRTRVRLDSSKIEFAKELIKQDISVAKLAEELQISRTHAWKLRKSLEYILPGSQATTTTDVKKSNCKQDNNTTEKDIQNQEPQTVQNSVNQNDSENQQKNDQTKNEDNKTTQENGEVNSFHTDDDDSEDCSEETESADESREDDCHLDETDQNDSSALPRTPQPGCSKISSSMMMKGKKRKTISCTNDVHNNCIKNDAKLNTTDPPYKRKPRKPNVFMTPEKYEQAKQLVSHRATTMEVAKQLNISQMSAWKLRDNILKGIPMTFKSPPIPRPREAIPRIIVPRQKLHGMKRLERDKIIKDAILAMIREDNNIQYWKVSEKLAAEKGIQLSASSVCQRLRKMGFQRRWKPADRCSQNDTLKSATSGGEEDNSSSLYGTTDTSQFLTTSFSDLV